ncbi:MAG: hypothetical protein U9P90_02125 [Patescibacteria group bacterium]|nr:hypothetical protein [Patescibacteria group bacterium]
MTKNKLNKVFQFNFLGGNINCYGKENFLKTASIIYKTIKNIDIVFKSETKVYKFLQEIENIKIFNKIENQFDVMSDYEIVNEINDNDIEIIEKITNSSIIVKKEKQEDVKNTDERIKDADTEKQPEQVKCEKCNALNILDDDQKFCLDCGELLRDEEMKHNRKKEQTKQYKKLQKEKETLKLDIQELNKTLELTTKENLEKIENFFRQKSSNFTLIGTKENDSNASKTLRIAINMRLTSEYIETDRKLIEAKKDRIEQIDEQLDGDFQLEILPEETEEIKTEINEAITA